jgi:hypothetical protein
MYRDGQRHVEADLVEEVGALRRAVLRHVRCLPDRRDRRLVETFEEGGIVEAVALVVGFGKAGGKVVQHQAAGEQACLVLVGQLKDAEMLEAVMQGHGMKDAKEVDAIESLLKIAFEIVSPELSAQYGHVASNPQIPRDAI